MNEEERKLKFPFLYADTPHRRAKAKIKAAEEAGERSTTIEKAVEDDVGILRYCGYRVEIRDDDILVSW